MRTIFLVGSTFTSGKHSDAVWEVVWVQILKRF